MAHDSAEPGFVARVRRNNHDRLIRGVDGVWVRAAKDARVLFRVGRRSWQNGPISQWNNEVSGAPWPMTVGPRRQ